MMKEPSRPAQEKWRVWFADNAIRGAGGATQTRAWVSDFERSGTIPVIELSAAKELVDALHEIHIKLTPKMPRVDGKDSWSPQQKFIDTTVTAALAKVPAEVLGED